MTQSSARGARKEEAGHRPTDNEPAHIEVESLRNQLEATKQELQAFAYSVSHDLRAPIRAIEGFSKILVEDFGASLDPEAKRFLQHVISNTQVLSGQIEDLLRYYRVAKAPPEKMQVDTGTLIERVIQEETAKAKIPKVEIKVDTLPKVFGGPELLRQAFSELIANAIKFTKTKKESSISLTARKGEAAEDIISIRDNGVGFDAKYANKLFQVFQKLHPIAEYPGNGIGLAIARRIVEMHGGKIWAESEAGAGATFHVALPSS
jgi:light-regulated signal transduction histidine kinase (bacteriophytochrome)